MRRQVSTGMEFATAPYAFLVDGSACSSGDGTDYETWSKRETGEYIQKLIAENCSRGDPHYGYRALRDGVLYVKKLCPESNKPWLDKLLEEAKSAVLEMMREVQEARPSSFPDSPKCAGKDQQWEDEARALGWYNGRLICYFCGEEECHRTPNSACELRKREILKIPESDDEDEIGDESD